LKAARILGAGVIGTRVPVIAISLFSRNARSLVASISDSARIAVFAGPPPVHRTLRATSIGGVAGRLQTDCIHAFWHRTRDQRADINNTQVRDLRQIAHESSIAQVSIFQFATISIVLALAVNCSSKARSVNAEVSQSAWIIIVAGRVLRQILTAARRGADIVCAWVFVVALHRISQASTVCAMVGHGTRVVIVTGAGVDNFVHTSLFPSAGIVSTCIAIIA